MFSLVTKCFVSEYMCTEQRPAEFRTPLYVVLATPLHISDGSDLSDETTIEKTSRRRFYSESSLCDVSFKNRRPLTPNMEKCMVPVKRTSHLSKYLNTLTPPKVVIASPKSSGRVLTSAKSIELMEEKEQKKQEK